MAAIKAYTDLEQSKKLAEILPLESADMCYINGGVGKISIGEWRNNVHDDDDIPCWSLSRLLSVIPNYKLSSEHNYHTCTAETSFGKETVAWFDNPIDACVAMIEKLNELNLL